MEIIAKISKGSNMDQIYIPKIRPGLSIGEYVIVKSLKEEKPIEKLYFRGINNIEPMKLEIIKEIIKIIDKNIENENVIITGSFLDKGFNFNDIDIIIIGIDKDEKSPKNIKREIIEKINAEPHLLILDNKILLDGLSKDPLYLLMLSKCISKKRFVYKIKKRINYKLLDLHLLKSKILINNFDLLNGDEKYYSLRNMVAISFFLENKKINKNSIGKEIKRIFSLDINKIRQNLINKEDFIKKYKLLYNKVYEKILEEIKNGSKQKQIN